MVSLCAVESRTDSKMSNIDWLYPSQTSKRPWKACDYSLGSRPKQHPKHCFSNTSHVVCRSRNKCPFMTTSWVGMFALCKQQKAPRLVIQINYRLPATTPGICSNSSIMCQEGHFSGTSFLHIGVLLNTACCRALPRVNAHYRTWNEVNSSPTAAPKYLSRFYLDKD